MQALFDGKPLLCTCLMLKAHTISNYRFITVYVHSMNNLIDKSTHVYGIADLIMQLKLSWVQFLKCLSLTNLDQDSGKKNNASSML